jgi:indolepyruvate ferredoxin oxidoreductase
VADRAAFDAAVSPATRPRPAPFDLGNSSLQGETRRLVEVRAQLLALHSDRRTAARYVTAVEQAWAAERAVSGRTAYSEAVARGLAHVLSYKDEYEVARLLTRPELFEKVEEQVPGATKVTYNLHPPLLRSLGMDSKLQLGAGSRPVMRLLARGKFLRGTPVDPFGRTRVRRVERALARDHAELITRLTGSLTEETYDVSVRAAAAAELIRGYEDIKLVNVDRYRAALQELGVA